MIVAEILAGGIGSRVGKNRPKQFVEVLGKPIIVYTIEIYQNNPQIDAILVVCHSNWKDYLWAKIQEYSLTKVKWIVDGGDTFQESCISGINYLKNELNNNDYLMIQYGAAPFTSDKIVDDVISVMKQKGRAVSATPCYQLMGSCDSSFESKKWIDRDKYIQIACPYGFEYGYICDVYKRAEEKGLIDSIEPHTTSLIYALGESLYLAYGDQTNIKITTSEDIDMFEGYVLMKNNKK